jgi:cell division protein FtsQ
VLQTISGDAFWNAQVGQIDITPEHKFELIPVLGSHVIKLGSGNNVGEKLAKLLVFYKQVLPKAGFAKYSALDVQFNGQVVAVRRGATSAVDSIQLQKNIQELMERKMAEQEPDEDVQPATEPVQTRSGDIEAPLPANDTVAETPAVEKEKSTAPTTVPAKSNTIKTSTPAKKPVTQKPSVTKKPAAPKPKAVMQRKAANEY